MTTPTLGVEPGRPRDVHSSSWFVDHEDGTVSYCIVRRAEAGAPNAQVLAFKGESDGDALAGYEEWRELQHERTVRNAERRSRWGPEGKGKMS